MPNWVKSTLDNALLNVLARVLVTYLYWSSGLEKLVGFHAAAIELKQAGLPAPQMLAAALIFTQLTGSLLVIRGGRRAWLGAGGLAVFTLITIPIAHRFWDMPPSQRLTEMYLVREHLSLCAGLFFTAAVCARSPGAGSSAPRPGPVDRPVRAAPREP